MVIYLVKDLHKSYLCVINQIKSNLVYLRNVVCGQDSFIKQVDNGGLKTLKRSAVMNPSLVKHQIH